MVTTSEDKQLISIAYFRGVQTIMGFNAVLTPEDLRKGDLVKPGWYSCEISSYSEEVTKGTDEKPSDGSVNAIFKFKVIEGENAGNEFRTQYNEKALGYGKELWAALEFPIVNGGYELSTELFERTPGSRIEVYIKRGKSNKNKEFNEVAGFRKPKA